MEIWKDIKGYEGRYQVSNLGNVKSLKRIITNSLGRKHTINERILSPGKDKDGYLQVNLHLNRKTKMVKIHRIVALTFIDNPNNMPIINHKDENKQNNKASNLEWCDYKYNVNYGNCPQKRSLSMKGKVGMRGENNPMYGRVGKLNPMYGRIGEKHPSFIKVICLNNLKVFNSIKEASDYANVPSIHSCLEGKSRYCGKLDGVKLVWETYDKYLNMTEEEIKAKINKSVEKMTRNRKKK